MNRLWIISILLTSVFLLICLKTQELSTLKPFHRSERSIKLPQFQSAKEGLNPRQKELLSLWESILTGRVAPVSKIMKDNFRSLGLSHVFTPSGFHLSAVIAPVTKILPGIRSQLILLGSIGLALTFLPGMAALKRMVLIKTGQRMTNLKTGFIGALIIDALMGTFQTQALSFTYSFLFLGIIYSGVRGLGMVIWFFIAQILLAYFQGSFISPLLLIFSPLFNSLFTLALPLLFLLSIPLARWQLEVGLFLLEGLDGMIKLASQLVQYFPALEVHIFTLMIVLTFQLRSKKLLPVFLLVYCSSLNLDTGKEPGLPRWEFAPRGKLVKIISKEEKDLIYFEDGRCERKLVRGMWWEKCSPARKRGSKLRI